MAKKLISKKTIIRDSGITSRIIVGLIFFAVSILFAAVTLFQDFSSEHISIKGIILDALVSAFIFIVFGCLIGLRQILQAIKILKYLYSNDFVIECDKVIDKYSVNDSAKAHTIVLEYNKAHVNLNEWKRINKGTKYYVFNLSNKETIIKSVSKYELASDLQEKVVDYHVNPINKFENWEEE